VYVPLRVKSNFSFLEGASHPDELVERAHALGLPALALTDRDGVYGVVVAHMKAQALGIRLLVGAEVNVEGGARVVLLAEDRAGYGRLCQLLSKGRLRSEKGRSRVFVDEVCAAAPGLLALSDDPVLLPKLRDAFGDGLFGALSRQLTETEIVREQAVRETCQRLGIRCSAANEVRYHGPARQSLHDVLACIRAGVTLAEAARVTGQNAEADLKSPHAMAELFADDAQALRTSLHIAERCQFSLSELRYRYPIEARCETLRQQTLQGALWRYGGSVPPAVQQQIERELALIDALDYGGYFLTMRKVVEFCQSAGILCQGRGSAANSVVCYCLGITAVDPIKLDLLFERFLSRERAEPPDIDLDIEHRRREEVIQWMYGEYGRDHAAMVANVIRYRTRSAVREVGKVLGLPLTALDRLSKLLGSRFIDLGRDALEHVGLAAPLQTHLLRLVDEIRDFPRHLSIHPGGFLLGRDPISTLVPIENASMAGRTVVQWDKYSIEDLGLFKVDLLGLGAMTQTHLCFDLLRRHYDVDLDMAKVPMDDRATMEMISRADTVGVFQIESRAQMSMLPRLRPRCFYDLVIEVAIIRPGPIQGGMVHPYLCRRDGRETPDYPHPSLERVLGKTLGVPIFQEQVMKIAMVVADYTPGEADQLRRDMAAWRSSGRIERHRDRLIPRMEKNGIDATFAERIFDQIRGFGEYGFPESHAASFALIAYTTAYLKCHYPAAFTCSLLNALPMGFYSAATLVEDAARHGVAMLPIDVGHSEWECTLEGNAVRMGMKFVRGFGVRERLALASAPPPYASIEDFVRRTGLSRRAVETLAEAGAFACVGRREALWAVLETLPRAEEPIVLATAGQQDLFAPLGRSEEVYWDYRTAGHSTRGHPMLDLRGRLDDEGVPDGATLNALPDGARARYVGMVICRQQPGTARGVTFFTLEDETGFVNLVVWQSTFRKYSVLCRTALLLGVSGSVQSEGGVVHLVADKLWEPRALFSACVKPRSFC
jgi:error-prone DNA polymerase